MKYISIFLRSIVITLLLAWIAAGANGSSEKPAPADHIIEVVRDCMIRSPAPWPDEWKQEYIETIRNEIELHRDVPHYASRMEILSKGFAPYWESLKKTSERSLFEVHRAQIRWYNEHLMGAKLPSGNERQKLRNQYTNIWDHAADSLLRQFPFLDPNAVEKAKADDLILCYRKIDAPLMPVYLRPFSEAQLGQIKQRWDRLRYARVDLWRRHSGDSTTPSQSRDAPSSNADLDYELTQKSLSQLLGQIWMVVSERPDYYISALNNRSRTIQDRLKSKRQARNNERRLEKGRSRQLLQTEHIGFLLLALLETPLQLDRSAYVSTQEQIPSEKQDKTAKGGDAYEVGIISTKK